MYKHVCTCEDSLSVGFEAHSNMTKDNVSCLKLENRPILFIKILLGKLVVGGITKTKTKIDILAQNAHFKVALFFGRM